MDNIPQRTRRTKPLVARLAEACNAVGGVAKKGRNEFQRYDYVKAADIAKAIRHELFKRGIVPLVDEKSWQKIADIQTNSGNTIALMQLTAEVSFIDESGKVGPIQAFATAMDSGDKAIFKAKTGLLKYALRNLALIPDEKDDPEFDESVDEQTDPRVVSGDGKKSRKKNPTIKEFQARAWSAACRQSGKTAEQEAKYLRARFSCASVMELTQEDFKDAIKWAAGTEELAKSLATSLNVAKGPQPVTEILDQVATDEFDQRVAGD